jgi:EAL domain-containing protein (putative c-di-GMP-specific phosphodiesterase class I)
MSEPRPSSAAARVPHWVLESPAGGGKHVRRLAIHPLPFRIGRRRGLELHLPYESISKEHAEIYWSGDALRLRDLHSTNGTFANQVRIQDAPLREGDRVRFAECEFRVVRRGDPDPEATTDEEPDTAVVGERAVFGTDRSGSRELVELLELEKVEPVFQPIVTLPARALVGYEALGRGRHPDLPDRPLELLRIAESIGVEAELSRLFRRKAVEAFRGRGHRLFLNTHPRELQLPGLMESLAALREAATDMELVIEIHESGITDPLWVAQLRKELTRLGMRLAFDDFGAGQSRIFELGDAPPHVLKFDRSLVNGIEQAPASRRRLIASLVQAASELLVETVAEGVETAAQAEVCFNLGFTHGQGHLFSHPLAAEQIGVRPAGGGTS